MSWKRTEAQQRVIDAMDEAGRTGSLSMPCTTDAHESCASGRCACICHDYTGPEL